MYEPLIGFRSEKGAQIAAFFAEKDNPIDKLKLIKLIYLSEREFLTVYAMPMLYDELFSLKHGPICSSCLNAINGEIERPIWDKYIINQDNRIFPFKSFNRDDLDHISDAEMDVLLSVWDTFGFMTASEVRNYTHKQCPEYTEIHRGRVPISYRDVLRAIGDEDADEIDDEISSFRRSEALLSAF